VVPEPALERGRPALLLRVHGHQGRVDVPPATLEIGSAPQLATWAHTWRRTRGRACWIRRSAAGASSSNARHTVGADATGPSTCFWWRRTSLSAITSPTVGEHGRQADQDPTPVMDPAGRASRQRPR
jgi:hypothetical protein